MYGDIIPPKRKIHSIHSNHAEEYNSVRFSSPHISYRKTKNKKISVIVFLASIVVIGLVIYQNLYHSTKIVITPKVARFEIKQKIPLILQGREKDFLTYSLVYVPDNNEESGIRNPFVASTSSNIQSSSTSDKNIENYYTITATTTGKTKNIIIVNKTNDNVPLRKDTRFDVDGVTYILDNAAQNSPSSKDLINSISSSTPIYKIIGFKGYPSYDTVYGIPESYKNNSSDSKKVNNPISSVPPKDLLSLMPAGTIALEKGTIQDKLLEQSAIVVFDQKFLEDFLRNNISQTESYYKILKSFGDSLTYNINIVDYKLETSQDTGKPISLTSLILEITPKVDEEQVKLQFSGFSKDTMDNIQKQINEYVSLDISYKPFWSDTVAKTENIQVQIIE